MKLYTEEHMRLCWNYAGDFFNEHQDEDGMLNMKFPEFIATLKPIDLKQTLIDFHIGAMKQGLIKERDKLWEEGYLPKIKEVAEAYYTNIYKEDK